MSPYTRICSCCTAWTGSGFSVFNDTSRSAFVTRITGVTNVAPAFGGANEEPIEDTKRRAPQALQTRDRAVTASDYESLALQVSTAGRLDDHAADAVAIALCHARSRRLRRVTGR